MDFAGSEGKAGKETQSVNMSLSTLGDVVAALGNGEEHVRFTVDVEHDGMVWYWC